MNSIDVDLSKNLLAPDFTTKGGKYLYPQSALQTGQKNVVKIKMTGSVPSDFRAANEAAGFSGLGSKAPSLNGKPYTWHHLDDFNPITGECTLQLVEIDVHFQVTGMAHSGSASQYRTYNGSGY
jgi:hypothetical protein